VLTISRLSRWSINYYNDTAREATQAGLDRRQANGGLGEYYSESDTRAPTWLIAGDPGRTAELVGLDGRAADGGTADPDLAARWLDDGITPNGAAGRGFTTGSVHGFDLTFAAPKSVSLLRALTDDLAEKVMQTAHARAITAAMTYLHQHAGYTRVHNPLTGAKDLQRLPGLVAIAYQHETSRCGDPHLHAHVIVPNRQARADGTLASIDSKSLFHEAKAAGIVYQAALRHELHARARRGMESGGPVYGNGRDRRRHQEVRQGVVAALHPAAGMGPKPSGRRRRCADRAAAGRRAESHPAGQAGIEIVGRA
jgi:conjugative relaxase-like TrwC/TraI family protein